MNFVSIPQWFDYNLSIRAVASDRIKSSQFHNGSITTGQYKIASIPDLKGLNSTMVRLQRLNQINSMSLKTLVSIPQWFDYNN